MLWSLLSLLLELGMTIVVAAIMVGIAILALLTRLMWSVVLIAFRRKPTAYRSDQAPPDHWPFRY